MGSYPIDVARNMQLFCLTLSERERRQYAAIEATKLGYGGVSYISGLLGISRDTINEGKKEIKNIALSGQLPHGRQRAVGGGRKKKLK
jgi:hypothetical protein